MPHAASFAASLLRTSARAYAVAAVARLRASEPHWFTQRLPQSFADPFDDFEVRVLQIAAAVEFDCPELLEHAAAWYRAAFHHRGVPDGWVEKGFESLAAVFGEELPSAAGAVVQRHLGRAIDAAKQATVELPSHLDPGTPTGRVAAEFLLAILEGRGEAALALVRQALADGLGVAAVHDGILIPVQREVGRMWLAAEIPIADEHYGSQIVDRVLWLLQETLPVPSTAAPTVLALGVSGNLHDFGLRVVAQRLQLAGYAVHLLGSNLPAHDLEWVLADRRFDLVAISATLSLHLHAAAASVATLRRVAGTRLPVLVGGEPFRIAPQLVERIGADAAAVDAAGAVAGARRLLGR